MMRIKWSDAVVMLRRMSHMSRRRINPLLKSNTPSRGFAELIECVESLRADGLAGEAALRFS